MQAHAYLAGPDVFYPDAAARGAAKKAHLAALGITGHFPLDNEIATGLIAKAPATAALAIARANEALMLLCVAPGVAGFILANMEPWHGPSMDVGTAFEMGFMSALAETARGRLTIIGYGPDARLFATRVQEMHFREAGCAVMKDGALTGPDGMVIENFGLADNLMLINAIEKTGGALCPTFEAACGLAHRRLAALANG